MRAVLPVNDHTIGANAGPNETVQPTSICDSARPKRQKRPKTKPNLIKHLSRSVAKFMEANPEFVFAFDVLKKVLVCSVIALSASALHALVDFLERHGVPPVVTLPIRLVEYLVFIVDVLWVTRVLVAEVFEGWRALLREAPIAKTSLGVTLLLLAVAATSNAAHIGFSDPHPPPPLASGAQPTRASPPSRPTPLIGRRCEAHQAHCHKITPAKAPARRYGRRRASNGGARRRVNTPRIE